MIGVHEEDAEGEESAEEADHSEGDVSLLGNRLLLLLLRGLFYLSSFFSLLSLLGNSSYIYDFISLVEVFEFLIDGLLLSRGYFFILSGNGLCLLVRDYVVSLELDGAISKGGHDEERLASGVLGLGLDCD